MLDNIKIGTRMVLGYGVIMALLVVVVGYSLIEINALNRDIDTLVNDRMPKTEQANIIIDNLNIIARVLRNVLLDSSKEAQATELARLTESRKIIGETLDKLQQSVKSEKGQELIKKVMEARTTYIKYTEDYVVMVKNGQVPLAKMMLFKQIREVQKIYFAALEELIAFQGNQAKKAGEEANAQARQAMILVSCLLVVALVVSFLSAFLIIRSITGPVAKTMVLAETMARGDFTARLEIDQKDEIGVMAKSLNSMVIQLGSMIKEIVGGINTLSSSSTDLAAVSKQLSASARDTADKSGAVATAAEEMSSNFQSVSAAMEQSSSNVGMVASATEEMTATVNEIGQNAEKARVISENAVKQSQLTSEKMSALGESARKVGKVTETITEISEQTNLLALNATIEAARAGEAGKGFAVVANEIKELAKQTAAATVDIKRQIDEMQTTTTSTVEDIARISEVIAEINNVINGIATAVEEQSAATSEIAGNISQASQGIGEVNENVAQSSVVVAGITRDIAEINQQSNQVGEGSGQVQTSAHGLSELADQLEKLVRKFKV